MQHAELATVASGQLIQELIDRQILFVTSSGESAAVGPAMFARAIEQRMSQSGTFLVSQTDRAAVFLRANGIGGWERHFLAHEDADDVQAEIGYGSNK